MIYLKNLDMLISWFNEKLFLLNFKIIVLYTMPPPMFRDYSAKGGKGGLGPALLVVYSSGLLYTWQKCCTFQLTEAVTAYLVPVQDQANPNPRMVEWSSLCSTCNWRFLVAEDREKSFSSGMEALRLNWPVKNDRYALSFYNHTSLTGYSTCF